MNSKERNNAKVRNTRTKKPRKISENKHEKIKRKAEKNIYTNKKIKQTNTHK